MFQLDGVELEFEQDALNRIAELTIERKTGARGLRSIIEKVLQKPMFETPSDNKIKKVVITKDTIDGSEAKIIKE